jgi:cysteine synthase A
LFLPFAFACLAVRAFEGINHEGHEGTDKEDVVERNKMDVSNNVLQSIGNTSLVQLHKVVPSDCAKIFAKLEWQNPTGSMKDRMAVAVISRAEADGRLSPGDTVVEYTGGSTGTSLALVCAAKGYPIHVVSSRAFSQEKLDHMVAYGAKLTLVPHDGDGTAKHTTKKMILDMVEAARKLSLNPHTYWVNQLHNTDAIAGYFPLGEEIWSQTHGRIDAFVQSVGTAASLRGVATVLKRYNPKIKIVAVEPEESSVLSAGKSGAHDIEGIGVGYTPPLWDVSFVDEVLSVKTIEAKDTVRQLARQEGLFAGTSSGGNVHAAIRVARRLGPAARVVTLMVDSGLKYLSTDLYRT